MSRPAASRTRVDPRVEPEPDPAEAAVGELRTAVANHARTVAGECVAFRDVAARLTATARRVEKRVSSGALAAVRPPPPR